MRQPQIVKLKNKVENMKIMNKRSGASLAFALAMMLAASALAADQPAYETQIKQWRIEREAELKADDGWLTLAGLYWLKEGANRIGSDAANDVVLPAGTAPARLGLIEFQDGKLTAGSIVVTSVQDVFGLPSTSFTGEQPGGWTPPDPTAYPVTVQRMMEASYRELVVELGQGNVNTLTDDDAYVGVLAKRPTTVALGFDLMTQIDGTGTYAQVASGHFSPIGQLAAALGTDPSNTTFTLVAGDNLDQVTIGSAVYIDNEIMRLDDFNANAAAGTIARGCVDSIPAQHAAGALVWISDDDIIGDPTKYQTGETIDAKLLTKTSSNTTDIADATAMSVTIVQRQARPYPVANLQIGGVSVYNSTPPVVGAGSVATWSLRNRALQSDQLIDYFAGSFTAEAGVTFEADVLDSSNVVLRTVALGAGSNYTFTSGDISGGSSVRFYSKRDGLRSLQFNTLATSSAAAYYQTETGTDHYQTEDGSGSYILE